jgi:hypothetical protein
MMGGLASKLLAVHRSLEAADHPHAFGGAIALAFCTSEARATVDLDVNVFVPVSRATEVFDVLPDGIAIDGHARARTDERGQVRLWWDDNAIDLFFSYHAFHDQASARARRVPFEGVMIPVLDCTDLLVFKALFDRTKDWADIEAMADVGSVDFALALRWVGELLGTESPQYRQLAAIGTGRRSRDAQAFRRALGDPGTPT